MTAEPESKRLLRLLRQMRKRTVRVHYENGPHEQKARRWRKPKENSPRHPGRSAASSSAPSTRATGSRSAAAGSSSAPHVAVGRAAAASSATTASSAEASAFALDGLEPSGDLLLGLAEQLDEITRARSASGKGSERKQEKSGDEPADAAVATVEERRRRSSVSGTTGTTNAVNVVVNVGGEIVVDDVRDVGDVESTSGDGGGDHDGRASRLEGLDGVLALALSAVAVDRGRGEVVLLEEALEHVGHALRLDEDEGEATRRKRRDDVEKDGALVLVLDVLDLLGDVLGGGSDTTDGQEDVVLEEVAREHLGGE